MIIDISISNKLINDCNVKCFENINMFIIIVIKGFIELRMVVVVELVYFIVKINVRLEMMVDRNVNVKI